MSLTGLSYIAPSSYAIPKMLSKSPLFAVNSKSITSSSSPMYLIGSSPIGASAENSCIPVLSASSTYLFSIPSSNIEQSIPLDSWPLITPFFISPPGSLAPGSATITLSPFLTFGAPHTISKTSFPIFTLHTCKWSESGCSSHSITSPIIKLVAFTSFPASSYSLLCNVISSAICFASRSSGKSI